ncbi:MAG: hypothetical protein RLN81_01675 [Balneolaceae bacterium]
MEKKKNSLTKSPILIVGLFALPGFAYGGFYYLVVDPSGGMALGGVLSLMAFFIYAMVLFFEQIILGLSNFSIKKVWLIEVIILLLVLFYFRNGIG